MDSEAIANGWGPKAFCPADEHYIPTLLASRGLDNETDCTVSEQACASGCFCRDSLVNTLPCMALQAPPEQHAQSDACLAAPWRTCSGSLHRLWVFT